MRTLLRQRLFRRRTTETLPDVPCVPKPEIPKMRDWWPHMQRHYGYDDTSWQSTPWRLIRDDVATYPSMCKPEHIELIPAHLYARKPPDSCDVATLAETPVRAWYADETACGIDANATQPISLITP